MTERILIALRETAKRAGITPAQAKYWVRLIGVRLVMKGRAGFLDVADSQKLVEMAELVAAGSSPKDAAFQVSGVVQGKSLVPVEQERQENSLAILEGKIVGLEQRNTMIEKALLLLVEENKALRKEVSRLADSNDALRAQLMPPLEPKKQVVPLAVPPRRDEGLSEELASALCPGSGPDLAPVRVWVPVAKKQPQYSFWQRFWYELTDPIRLRAS